MTRSEKKKLALERYKQHQMESSVRCVQSCVFVVNCKTCEHCRIAPYFESEKWFCGKKARKPMIVSNGFGVFNSGLPYNDVNGKCDYFTFLTLANEE